jgi:hypothetical protein
MRTHTTTRLAEAKLAARRLYDAEVALHIAPQSGVDSWIRAAAERLHEAVEAHRQRLADCPTAA